MLENSKAFSGIGVRDTDQAREFYRETLGLKISMLDEENGLLELELAGDRTILVYRSPDATPASYTVLNFPVGDIDEGSMSSSPAACGSSAMRVWSRTRRACFGESRSVRGRTSPGSRTHPGTCCRCSRRARSGPPLASRWA
jgi:hypothetical protein